MMIANPNTEPKSMTTPPDVTAALAPSASIVTSSSAGANSKTPSAAQKIQKARYAFGPTLIK